jgi:choline dehydrogenase
VSAGAYFSPTILLRSGIGRADELTRHGLAVLADLPIGEPLLDHHGVGVAWEPTDSLQGLTETHLETADLYEPYVLLKAASSACPPGSWDLHVLTWLSRSDTGRFEPSVALFHMQPRSTGRVELRSTDAADSPVVDHGFLTNEADVEVLAEGIEIVRSIAATEPLHELLDVELRPGPVSPEEYARTAVRNYFHPSGTCAIGRVLDSQCRVLGIDGLLVVDASVMPTIPRAGTNLTTAAIAERVATFFE